MIRCSFCVDDTFCLSKNYANLFLFVLYTLHPLVHLLPIKLTNSPLLQYMSYAPTDLINVQIGDKIKSSNKMKLFLQVAAFVFFQPKYVVLSASRDSNQNVYSLSGIRTNLRGRELGDSSCFDCSDKNPCGPPLFTNDVYYYPRCGDVTTFVQCGNTGECHIQSCPGGQHWDPDILVCGLAQPTHAPSAAPSASPSASPSAQPSSAPSASPSASPSAQPSAAPSTAPSASPSASPSAQPSAAPSASPSASPSAQPSALPSAAPSSSPTDSCFDCTHGKNPCDPLAEPGKYYYSNCDVHKYVQCSAAGQCYQVDCPVNLRWDDAVRTCISV